MYKKSNARLAGKIKEHEEEIKEVTHIIVDHLGALARKHLENLAASDSVHTKLEDLL